MKKAFIILGNGFTIDFLHYYQKIDKTIFDKIDVCNLFHLGDKISPPWEKRPGFLSYKNCPALWSLGARPNCSFQESTALIEEIITCANMFFDFINDDAQKQKRLDLLNSENRSLHLKAYSELIVYLRHLFTCYNLSIDDSTLKNFVENEDEWGWLDFFKQISIEKYDSIVFVTYNYDIWLERILQSLNIEFSIAGFSSSSKKIEIIKPHGSISFVPRNYTDTSYSINYNLDYEGSSIDQFELKYTDLDRYDKGAIIPPAGDSSRLRSAEQWSKKLRQQAKGYALKIAENDEVVLCGISYWHVDRREIDEILISLNQHANFTFINPSPPRDLNAVLTSIFSKYIQQNTSLEIGRILYG